MEVAAPAPLDKLLERYLQAPPAHASDAALEAFASDTRRTAIDLLATEGYFSPTVRLRIAPGKMSLGIDPGPRTVVSAVSITIQGDLAPERRRSLLAAWPLRQGMPFRDGDWNEAKQSLLRRLLDSDYAGAKLAESRVEIDPAKAEARLFVRYESGPRYVFGPLRISGLTRYPPDLIHRYSRIKPGAPYEQEKLLALQSALQRTGYFNSVSVELVQPQSTPDKGTVEAPVLVYVREREPHHLSLGAGVSSNTGAQTELVYKGYDFLHRAWQIGTGLRLEQLRQSLYADIHLPSQDAWQDSFGVLTDREDIQGLKRQRTALGAVRTKVHGAVESRYALNWQQEIRNPRQATSSSLTALTLDGTWTLRRVDSILDPHRGFVAQVEIGGGSRMLLSDRSFLRLHGRYQHYFPLGGDVLTLRAELGTTLAAGREGIPQDFLFRTGGAQSVRGYAYQSLGVREGNAIVGGRYLAVASAEYTRWLTPKWGGAVFIDAGNAGDDLGSLKAAVGYGVGVRWKSPAGPLAVDLAYGERDRQLRLHFSLAIAF